MIDKFVIYQPIPRILHEDEEQRWIALHFIWYESLREKRGVPVSGPLQMTVIDFGYIDDNTLREVYVSERSREWTFATWRVIGPAVHK